MRGVDVVVYVRPNAGAGAVVLALVRGLPG